MEDKRFNCKVGEDYELLRIAYPHHDEFQDQVINNINSLQLGLLK